MARRRSTTSISATRPVFPSFLLPSFNFGFRRRPSAHASSPTASSSPDAQGPPAASSTLTTASPSSPPAASGPVAKHHAPTSERFFLSRSAPDTLRCMTCSTDLALASQIISKGFTGRYGRAFLVAPPPPPADNTTLLNIRIGRSEDRQLVTGWHAVADICCATCSRKLGWKYVDAKEQSQKYKVGKYILETERVMSHRSWEDCHVQDLGLMEQQACKAEGRSGDDIVFDSDDEEECEDIFAGTWDAATVAKRRSESIARQLSVME
ncbi:yippee family protein [Metarhizium album ARSEF 1941]|uniref:Yippee family protein n=1 Tax=Metarhizium album (strain ARSEF 1941) TaxID=1081103 RepID=A0A0B2WLD6_METAS|nr:yippee family protein [Metarhizium album ARSEF 1941]KHN94277.1 yippee family protein [Metarhizium album ARSEF 1941]